MCICIFTCIIQIFLYFVEYCYKVSNSDYQGMDYIRDYKPSKREFNHKL